MKKRSEIVSELVKAGFLKGSKQYKKEYLRRWQIKNRGKYREYQKKAMQARRLDPNFKVQERARWKRWYERKKDTDPKYLSTRIKAWRQKNPDKWNSIAKRASQNGLHKRWYKNNRARKLKERREYEIKRNPLFGLTTIRRKVKNGDESIDSLISKLSEALVRIEQECSEG